ncbi:MAG: hypothetical protein HY666_02640 [Chloroflexi bacterium]|nr:hypothetical protein [Chloroflexota bacterium]
MNIPQSQQVFVEVFPVQASSIPKLFAYRLELGRADASTVGGKLAYRLRRTLGGHWVWTSGRLVADTQKGVAAIMKVVSALWSEQPDIFKDLRRVVEDPDWRSTPQVNADFVARGLIPDLEPKLRSLLAEKRQDLGDAFVDRVYDTRSWVVQGRPAVSISISSRLIHKQDLKTYASSLTSLDDLLGLWAADKTSSLKGEIVEIIGPLREHRERLLALTQREEMQGIIQKTPDDETVVRLLSGHNEYEYVVSALRIIVRMEDLRRFRLSSQQALKGLRSEPGVRSNLIKPISDLVKDAGLVSNAFNSAQSPGVFVPGSAIGFKPELRFGNNQKRSANERTLLRDLRDCGLFCKSSKFSGRAIRIAVLNAMQRANAADFLSRLRQEIVSLGFQVDFIGEQRVQTGTRVDMEIAINNLSQLTPDVIVAFFPGQPIEEEDESGIYNVFKSLTVSRGIPGQVVYDLTLDKQYALANIVLGVLSKVGNVPFVLGEPLPYADLVVGIDIARERKRRLAGSINATAIARIYFTNGEFLRYVIHDAPLEGETVPDGVLQSLFPVNEFKDKRVVIHRDGYFRGGEKQALRNWAQRIGGTFHLVEVIKTGTPRLYASSGSFIGQPPKGTAFKLSDTEAFLVSTLPPFTNATPQPLHVRSDPPLKVEQAIHSILSLTLLHYGSLRLPRLPVTIHYSDRIAYMALRGIKPRELEGNVPFWL